MTDQVQDAEVVEPGTEIVPVVAATPAVKASDLVERLSTIREAMNDAMTRDVDYGVIPGTGSKPTLLKPGAEKLAVLFQLDVQITHDENWGPGDHLTVPAKAIVYHAPSGSRLGSGEGMCTTRERKYAYRRAERKCPSCGKEAVIAGKREYGGGWLCWKKRDGCNAKFAEDDPAIVDQATGDIENPDLPDTWNTVIKMARKRALVDAVLLVTGASALFTQDVEDMQPSQSVVAEPVAEPAKPKRAQREPSRKLEPDELTRVVNAINESEYELVEVMAEIKRQALEDLTVDDAKKIHQVLHPDESRFATKPQQAKIRKLAEAKGVSPCDLADIVTAAHEGKKHKWESQSQAEAWLESGLDQLPSVRVPLVVKALENMQGEPA